MPIEVRDGGVDKTVQAVWAYDAGVDKEVQEVIVHDSGTDKTVFNNVPTLPDSFEAWSGGLPDGWTVSVGSSSAIVQNSSFSTDGTYSVELQAASSSQDQIIMRDFDLSGFTTISVDVKVISCLNGGCAETQLVATDINGDRVTGDTPRATGTYTINLDISTLDTNSAITIRLEAKTAAILNAGNDAAFDNLRGT